MRLKWTEYILQEIAPIPYRNNVISLLLMSIGERDIAPIPYRNNVIVTMDSGTVAAKNSSNSI